jgi:phage terminase large subunit-like protein
MIRLAALLAWFLLGTMTEPRPDWRALDLPHKIRLRWLKKARPSQLTPGKHHLCQQDPELCELAILEADLIDDPEERETFLQAAGHFGWFIWLILSGRGWGKTRTGAEDVVKYALEHPRSRIALVAPTYADGRDTMVEGESGVLGVLPKKLIADWNRSIGELILTNGSRMKIFSAEKPERLRGPQHHRAWCDEVAAWQYLQETWDMLLFGLRLGKDPQVVITTTPKPLDFLRALVKRAALGPVGAVVKTTGSTFENSKNLARAALAELKSVYAGTRMGRQELDGEVLEDIEGALWSLAMIEEDRLAEWLMPEWRDVLGRTVVAVDPAVTSNPDSDETGIVVVALTRGSCPFCHKAEKPHAIVLEDMTGTYSPREWGLKVEDAYTRWEADRIVAEVNQGGDLVSGNITATAPHLPVKTVHAVKSKVLRAEPVFALYEKHVVHHWDGNRENLRELEKEMTSWDPTIPSSKSPNRLDSLVYALTELMLPASGSSGLSKIRDRRHRGRR